MLYEPIPIHCTDNSGTLFEDYLFKLWGRIPEPKGYFIPQNPPYCSGLQIKCIFKP